MSDRDIQIIPPRAGVFAAAVTGRKPQRGVGGSILQGDRGGRRSRDEVRCHDPIDVGQATTVVEKSFDQVGTQAVSEIAAEPFDELRKAVDQYGGVLHPATGQDVEGTH